MNSGSWRDIILNEFVPNISNLTIATDPDGLLTEEKLSIELKNRGFDLIDFYDSIEFRYAYESGYRNLWDQGKQTEQAVILHLNNSDLDNLPYDLLSAGRVLHFDLGSIFPNLSYSVVEKLDRGLLDKLFALQIKYSPPRLGDNATKDFILMHLFGIDTHLIGTDVELIHTLLRIHYKNINIPLILCDHLDHILKESKGFRDWPVKSLFSDKEFFFEFLQERWPVFLDSLIHDNSTIKEKPPYHMKYKGPKILPFDHEDIRVYIDNLFVEDKLKPVQKAGINIETIPWIKNGISDISYANSRVRLNNLLTTTEKLVPDPDSRYQEWIEFAKKWAELSALVHLNDDVGEFERFQQMSSFVNAEFTKWLHVHYASLINLPPTSPAMLHHVPRQMARKYDANAKLAIVVVDGLSLAQWFTIKKILLKQDPNLFIRDTATFAWIPTLTSVSRQAIFSGKPPIYYPNSITSTNNESNLWRQFWEENGLSRLEIGYSRGLGDGDAKEILDENFNLNRVKALGLVVDKVDKIMHGMQLGASGMHNQIEQWCQKGFLSSLIGYLLDNNYQVWLTSDHGNIECKGKGRPYEGVIAETRGERVRVYPNLELRDSIARKLPFTIKWPCIGLPPGYFPLIVGGSDAFVKEGNTIVGHGGISLEEVIVPLAKFDKRKIDEQKT